MVSVVFPVYKVERYIEESLTSIINQTYKDIQLIIVNDCTPDNSMIIAERILLENGFTNYIIINNETNKGLSEARNVGIRAAEGDFICFVDSDDVIKEDCIELLVAAYYKNSPSFVMSEIVRDKNFHGNATDGEEIITNPDISFFRKIYYDMTTSKMCSRSFILENDLFFEPNVLHEDTLWSFKLLLCSKKIVLVHNAIYYYMDRENSITNSFNYVNINDKIKICSLMLDYLDKNNGDINTYKWVLFEYFQILKTYSNQGYKLSEFSKMRSLVRKNSKRLSEIILKSGTLFDKSILLCVFLPAFLLPAFFHMGSLSHKICKKMKRC